MSLFEDGIDPLGRTTCELGSAWRKSPDFMWALPTREMNPVFVIELGMQESRQKLGLEAQWWLEKSSVNVVVTIDIHRTKMEIRIGRSDLISRRYSSTRQSPRIAQEIKSVMISRPNDTTLVTGQLDIPFAKFFLRPPTGALERDLTFSVADLIIFAELIWRRQGLLEW